MAVLGKLTFEVLVRPKGSTDEPQVVGELTVDLDTKKAETPEPIPPLPDPPTELPEFIPAEES